MNVHTMNNPTVYELYSCLAKLVDAGHGERGVIVCAGRKRLDIIQVATRPNSDHPAEIDTRER
jgi:hypothetical protein